jgi:CTP:molybdopterin cytidylyltransferase MocA
MGSPKALVPFHGQTFLAHLLDIAGAQPKSEIGGVRVVLGSHAGEITAALGLDPEIVVLNPEWEQGQLSSIQAAIRSLGAEHSARQPADDETDGIILFLVDHPLVSAAVVASLIA